ncbi:hypothetical protein Tco_1041136 [Tanacetum coccineum]|uniref:Uncharacterized protein n=1 Tax=Tanacetum coccineum TaxID=301880 RepID=A0ABQ5GGS4_9ASTR
MFIGKHHWLRWESSWNSTRVSVVGRLAERLCRKVKVMMRKAIEKGDKGVEAPRISKPLICSQGVNEADYPPIGYQGYMPPGYAYRLDPSHDGSS